MSRPAPGAVAGLRRCVHCRYSLTGQPIIRDEDYAIFFVRCPECGAVASLQEYAVTGWLTRLWTVTLAITWCLVMLAALFLGSLALFGLCQGTTAATTDTYRMEIYRGHAETGGDSKAARAMGPGVSTVTIQGNTFVMTGGSTGQAFSDWWESQDKDALLASAGGRWGALNKIGFVVWVPLAVAAFLLGCFWAVTDCGARGVRRFVWVVLSTAVTAMYATIQVMTWFDDEVSWTTDAALQQLGLPVMIASIAVTFVALTAGVFAGRPLARLGVRLTIPARLCGGLALLWLTDGRTPPLASPRPPAR